MKDKKKYVNHENPSLDKDVATLFENVSRMEHVTTNPNGSRVGRYTGESVLYTNGGNSYVSICIAANTTNWRSIQLTLSL